MQVQRAPTPSLRNVSRPSFRARPQPGPRRSSKRTNGRTAPPESITNPERFVILAGGWWLVAGGWWLVAGGWWLVAGGWWLVAGGWWLVAGGWWLVAGSWWLVAGGWWLAGGGWLPPFVPQRLVIGAKLPSR